MSASAVVNLLLVCASAILVLRVARRLQLSLAKHPSLRGHSRWARRIARWVPYYSFDQTEFYCSDGATESIAQRRRNGLQRLVASARSRSPLTLAAGATLGDCISDVSFTSAYRVPFQYRAGIPQELRQNGIASATNDVRICDLDGNWRYDLTASYGVNVFGYDFYKTCMAEGNAEAEALGPLLGPYHPVTHDNVRRICAIAGLDAVSFHMSGTEAVMQAVRLARYHTGRSHLVRLCGAYHGWWDGVQPGVGNTRDTRDVYTLRDLSQRTLRVLETRRDIACVLINPLQALHPNADAPSDATLVSQRNTAHFDRAAYTVWLQAIRKICSRRGIVLIFDEVFTGFRLAYGGAQEYFGVRADMVTYGKTLGGGLPVGVVCGRRNLMQRFRETRPADIAFARGTFNSHPYVMTCMNAFLRRIEQPSYRAIYAAADALWNQRVAALNARLAATGMPVSLANMHSIITVQFTAPGRYHWMLQFYLRDAGLELPWIGSGRFIMSLNYSDADVDEVGNRMLLAVAAMARDGWWEAPAGLSDRTIKRRILEEMLRSQHLQPGSTPPPRTDTRLERTP